MATLSKYAKFNDSEFVELIRQRVLGSDSAIVPCYYTLAAWRRRYRWKFGEYLWANGDLDRARTIAELRNIGADVDKLFRD